MDIRQSFERHFVVADNGCWNWTGGRFKKRGGYGYCTMRKHGILGQRAHRVAWRIYCGPVTPDQHVLHRCDNPLCVNPDHLFLGNQVENMKDKVAKGRQTWGETHGPVKLTADIVRMIRTDPRRPFELGPALGVSETTIRDIRTRRSWKHLS